MGAHALTYAHRLTAKAIQSVIVGRMQTFKMLNIAQKFKRNGQILRQILNFLRGGKLIDKLPTSLSAGKSGPWDFFPGQLAQSKIKVL